MVRTVMLRWQPLCWRRVIEASAFLLLLLTPFLVFLRFHGYQLWTQEVALLVALFTLAAVCLFMLHRRGSVWRIVGLTVALLVFVDLQFDTEQTVSFKLLPIALILVVWVLREHLAVALGAAVAVFAASSLLLPMRGSKVVRTSLSVVSVDESLRPVFHIVFDELSSTDHLRHAGEEATAAAMALESVLERNAFLLFSTALSRYAHTEQSMGAVLNDTVLETANVLAKGELMPGSEPPEYRWPFVLQSSSHFRDLAEQGYVARIYQSDFLDFCRTGDIPVEGCTTYPGNNAGRIAAMDLSAGRRAAVLLFYYLETSSHFYAKASGAYRSLTVAAGGVGVRLPVLDWNLGIIGSSFREVARLLEAEAEHGIRGRVFLVHAIDPHYPYVRDASCRTVGDWTQWLEGGDPAALPDRNTTAGRRRRYARYGLQAACLARDLEEFISWVDRQPDAGDAVVILHGDHGSRISIHRPSAEQVDVLDAVDVGDLFSTLFAVRAPGLSAGRIREVVEVGEVLSALRRSQFTAVRAREIDTITVFLEGRGTGLRPLMLKRRHAGGANAWWVGSEESRAP